MATREPIADVESGERFAREMTVEGEELEAVFDVMFKDDHGTVVEKGLIIGEGVDGGVEGG